MRTMIARVLAVLLVGSAHAQTMGGLLGVQSEQPRPTGAFAFADPTPTENGEVDLMRSWGQDAANGVQLTVVSRKSSEYVISKVEYMWQPGDRGEVGFEADASQQRQLATSTDARSKFAHLIRFPDGAGKTFETVEESWGQAPAQWHVGARVTLVNPSATVMPWNREKVVELFGRAPAMRTR